jgi:LPS export ABC transporter protein LptC
MGARRIAKVLAMFGTAALVAIVAVAVYVVRHRSLERNLNTVAGIVPGALLHAHNFHWTQMKGGQSQWVLKARDATYSADKTSLVLGDATVSMTGKDGKPIGLFAPVANLKLAGNHVTSAHLSGGVTMNDGGFVLTTDDATFSPDDDRIEAPGPVKIDGKGLSVTGIGLTGHPKAETFELLKRVSTRILPRQKGASKISS